MKRNGKYKGGLNNIHYTYEVLVPKLFPFFHEITLQVHEPNEFAYNISPLTFMQDGTPSHISQWIQCILKNEGIPIYEHVGNSPDMNAIEKLWIPIRIAITNN
jgi:hypothetical protein